MGAFDNPAGFDEDVPAIKPVRLGTESNPLGEIFVKNLTVLDGETSEGPQTASAFNLLDGSDKNYSLATYAAGTAYSLTATSAALDFGTTDPVVTLNKAGTYLILGKVNLRYTAATFAASRTVTLKLRRTNNTAVDLSNGSRIVLTDIITTLTYTFGVFDLPPVLYTTTNTDDAITIFGDVSVLPSAGSLDAVAAELIAVRLY